MNDVAIAEGDAGKGEIVISPIAHSILHGFTTLQSTAPLMARETICGMVGGESGEDPSPVALDPSHPLACGCTVTPSGYFNINTSLDDELCTVDFAATAAARSNNAAMMQLDTRDFEGDKDLQYEFETYAHVIDELMSGYKVVSPLLQKEFAGICKKMGEESAAGAEPLVHVIGLFFYTKSHFVIFYLNSKQTLDLKMIKPTVHLSLTQVVDVPTSSTRKRNYSPSISSRGPSTACSMTSPSMCIRWFARDFPSTKRAAPHHLRNFFALPN